MKRPTNSDNLTQDSKTLITILTLFLAFPIGLVLMWLWTSWPRWLKIVITTIPILIILLVSSLLVLIFSLVSQSIGHGTASYSSQTVINQSSPAALPR